MKISIVLSTYNGKAYITEQLDSILNQTRKADEVLIFDDCSTDNTPQISYFNEVCPAIIPFMLKIREKCHNINIYSSVAASEQESNS